MYNILCFGDSNTFGTNPRGGRWDRTVRWTGLLQEYLGSDYYIIEEGLGGRNTLFDDPLEPGRNGLALLPMSLQSHKPLDLVVISLGTNDCKVHFNANIRIIAKGLETLVKTVLQFPFGEGYPIPKVLIISPIHIGTEIEHSPFASFDSSSYEKSLALAPLFEQVAHSYGCLFLDASSVASPSAIDQLHMDAQAHENLAKALVPILQKLFGDERQLFLQEELIESKPELEIETPEISSAEEEAVTSLQIEPVEPQAKKSHRGLSFRIPGFSKKKGD